MSNRPIGETGPLDEAEGTTQLFRILARANRIASNTELDELLAEMLELIALVCGANGGTLYLLDRETNELVFKVVYGDKEAQKLVGQRFSIDKGISGTTIREARAIIVEDLQNDPRWFGSLVATSTTLKNTISFPLLVRSEAIGVVQVFNYTHTPLELAQLLGNRMASE